MREAAEAGEYDDALWRELVELGWPGIAVSEEHGGQGLGAVELAVLLEELGYACAATPLLCDRGRRGGDPGRRHAPSSSARWLPALVSGELTAGHRHAPSSRPTPTAPRSSCCSTATTPQLVERARGRAARRDRSDAPVRDACSGDGEPLGAGAADRVRAAIAAEVVGVCQRALEMTLEYVKDRKQFGVPVGSFQAVSHRCAQMLLHTESARSTAYFAAWAADADPERLAEAAALAAAAAADGGREVTASAIQAHGGIGFTWEADVHWLYKRAQLDAALLGGARRHRAALARLGAARAAGAVTA